MLHCRSPVVTIRVKLCDHKSVHLTTNINGVIRKADDRMDIAGNVMQCAILCMDWTPEGMGKSRQCGPFWRITKNGHVCHYLILSKLLSFTSSYSETLKSTTIPSAGDKDQFQIEGIGHHGTSRLELSVNNLNIETAFLARDSIYAIARYMPSPVRLSVCPSVCLSHGWISQRRLKLGSRNLHGRVAP